MQQKGILYCSVRLTFKKKKVQKLDTAVLCTAWKHSGFCQQEQAHNTEGQMLKGLI